MQDNCNDKSGWTMLIFCFVSVLVFTLACIGGYTVLKNIHTESLLKPTGEITLGGSGGSNLEDLELDFEAQSDVIHATSTTGVKEVVIESTEDRIIFTSEANPILYKINADEIHNLTHEELYNIALVLYLNGKTNSMSKELREELLELFVPVRFKVEDGG